MNLMQTIPLVAITLALFWIKLIIGGKRNSRNLSTYKEENYIITAHVKLLGLKPQKRISK